MSHLVVLGGSDAGISAALRAREINPALAVTVVVADAFPNYSICGLPFYLSGETPDWHQLAHRSVEDIAAHGITLLLNHRARAIDPSRRVVTVTDEEGYLHQLVYDQLIVATGAAPLLPAIMGLDLPGVFPLHTMQESFHLHHQLDTQPAPRSSVIVGGGYIGLEMADALTHRGVAVTLLQRGPTVLTTVDPSLGGLVAEELRRHGVAVVTDIAVNALVKEGDQLRASGAHEFTTLADLVLVATGVRPVTDVARTAGVKTGLHGAIQVTRAMQTTVPYIFAAGDCVETWHRVLEQPTYLPLGTTAHKQGRVAGENAAGGTRTFAGTVGTQVVKLFDLAIARTGLLEAEAADAGFDPRTVEVTVWDHKAYYPGAQPLHVRITGDRRSGRLLGAQIVGHWQSEVAKRVDVYAAALFHGMRINDLNDLDLSYTPPLSSPWDPIQLAAQAWERAGASDLKRASHETNK